jgi:lipopolysaccharide/colanic/teichoic acid biosynthesis glycosyltransferase
MVNEQAPSGPAWPNSLEKRRLDAYLARESRMLSLWITHSTLQLLAPSQIFSQKRVGQGGRLFSMFKVQTMDAIDIPLHDPKSLSLAAQIVRRLAFDELVQIVHVSEDPMVPGDMSVIGLRPQLPEEIEHMYAVMAAAGKEDSFFVWYRQYCAMRPGILGPDSLLGERYEPNTLPFYEARCRSTDWYYHNGSEMTDLRLYASLLAAGAYQIKYLIPQMYETP